MDLNSGGVCRRRRSRLATASWWQQQEEESHGDRVTGTTTDSRETWRVYACLLINVKLQLLFERARVLSG